MLQRVIEIPVVGSPLFLGHTVDAGFTENGRRVDSGQSVRCVIRGFDRPIAHIRGFAYIKSLAIINGAVVDRIDLVGIGSGAFAVVDKDDDAVLEMKRQIIFIHHLHRDEFGGIQLRAQPQQDKD